MYINIYIYIYGYLSVCMCMNIVWSIKFCIYVYKVYSIIDIYISIYIYVYVSIYVYANKDMIRICIYNKLCIPNSSTDEAPRDATNLAGTAATNLCHLD